MSICKNDIIKNTIECVYEENLPISDITLIVKNNKLNIKINFYEKIDYYNNPDYSIAFVGLEPYELILDYKNITIERLLSNILIILKNNFGVIDYNEKEFWMKMKKNLYNCNVSYEKFLNEYYCQDYLKNKMMRELKK